MDEAREAAGAPDRNPSKSCDLEILLVRLALSRGWLDRKACQRVLETALGRAGDSGAIEDALRLAGLSAEQVRTLRGALGSRQREVRIGDWRLVRRIGIGGMGSVFEARHRRTLRRAAVKVLLPRLGRDPEFTRRFLREAQALARISHPNVVHAYDAGQDGDFYFIAMELVEGEDLQRYLNRERCMAPARSAEVALSVARALGAIEQAGIIHRDVKPANILIDPSGAVKLADLGLFRDDFERREAWEGPIFGTPQYMSPEQVLGREDLDIRSDLYSLGATWYHALIGNPPFLGSLSEVARAQVEAQPVPPRDIRPDVPLSIDRLILHLMEKDAEKRPSGPASAAAEIEAALKSLGWSAFKAPAGLAHGGRRRPLPRRLWLLIPLAAAALAFSLHLAWTWGWSAGGGRGGRTSAPSDPGGEAAAIRWGDGEIWDAWLEPAASGTRRAISAAARSVSRAIPRPWRWHGSPGAAASGAAPAVAALPSGALPSDVAAWARAGSLLARDRLARAVGALPEGTVIPVLFKDGTVFDARAGGKGSSPFLGPQGKEVELARLHPASVIVWAALDEGALPDAGVSVALWEGESALARALAEARRVDLPPVVLDLLRGSASAKDRRTEAALQYLSGALEDLAREERALSAMRQGRFAEAREELASLLAPVERSAVGAVRHARWTGLRDRTERLEPQVRLLSRPALPVDVLASDGIRVVYPLDSPNELVDFRFDGRAWSWQEGTLVREAAPGRARSQRDGARSGLKQAGSLEPLETIALYAPPVAVDVRWSPPGESARGARLVLGHAGRFVVVGGDAGPAAWQGDLEAGPLAPHPDAAGAGPAAAGGEAVRVEFGEDGAAVILPGGERVDLPLSPAPVLPVPRPGRVTVALEAGSRLIELAISASLDPVWAAERSSRLRKR